MRSRSAATASRHRQIFINVGGSPTVPDWPGLRDVPFLTSTTMMDVDFLPEHLVVVGGSYIGLEFAQIYRRFGSKVSVIEYADRLIAREDAGRQRRRPRRSSKAKGSTIVTGARDIAVAKAAVRRAPSRSASRRDSGGSREAICSSRSAGGRTPPTLGSTPRASPSTRAASSSWTMSCRPMSRGVYALGDCNGRGAFTHTSYNDYEIVAANLLDGDSRRLSDRIPTYALFTDPPLGRVGMTEAEVRASGRPALVAKMPMTRVGRARERGETQGLHEGRSSMPPRSGSSAPRFSASRATRSSSRC